MLTDGLTDRRTNGQKIGRIYRTMLQAGAIKIDRDCGFYTILSNNTFRPHSVRPIILWQEAEKWMQHNYIISILVIKCRQVITKHCISMYESCKTAELRMNQSEEYLACSCRSWMHQSFATPALENSGDIDFSLSRAPVCLCWGFTAQSTQWGHVKCSQFT